MGKSGIILLENVEFTEIQGENRMEFKNTMESALTFSCDNPIEKIVVVKSLAQGRRMLQWLASQGTTLLNVRVETPTTLAMSICMEQQEKNVIDSVVAINLIHTILKEQTQGFYGREICQTKKVAELLYQTFLELELNKVGELSEGEK